MPLFEQVWLFIMCYHHWHCFLAQRRDYSDFHVTCYFSSFTVLRNEVNSLMRTLKDTLVLLWPPIWHSLTQWMGLSSHWYLSGRWSDGFLRHRHFAVILCYIHCPYFYCCKSCRFGHWCPANASCWLPSQHSPANDWAKQAYERGPPSMYKKVRFQSLVEQIVWWLVHACNPSTYEVEEVRSERSSKSSLAK